MTAQHSSASAKDPRDGFQFTRKDFFFVPALSVSKLHVYNYS